MKEEAKTKVCQEILRIMETFHEQEAKGSIDTPGGLEHMWDVWMLFKRWEDLLLQRDERQGAGR